LFQTEIRPGFLGPLSYLVGGVQKCVFYDSDKNKNLTPARPQKVSILKSSPLKNTAIEKTSLGNEKPNPIQLNAVAGILVRRNSRGLLARDELCIASIFSCVRFVWPRYLAVDIFMWRTCLLNLVVVLEYHSFRQKFLVVIPNCDG
jgi:hypothetical protein